jgi:hypothetical protein
MTTSPSVTLITNATVAQYIHEISVRHRRQEPDWWSRRAARARADEAAARSAEARRRETWRRRPPETAGLVGPGA